jgi:sec-independent protein translocase protein TatC
VDPWLVALAAASVGTVGALAWAVARVSRQARELHGRSMGLLDHLRELRYRALASLASVGGFAMLLFSFGVRWTDAGGWRVPVPWPTVRESLAADALTWILDGALPAFVEVYAMTPTEAIMALVETSLIGAVVLAAPVVAYQVAAFVAPALHPGERRLVARLAAPSLGLYLAGVAFAGFVMVPLTLELLYGYAGPIGATPIARPSDVLTFVLLATVVFGVAFQTPLVMAGLASAGIASPEAMARPWRIVVVGVLVVGALVTDPNPITQLLVGGPLVVLYGIGLLAAKAVWRGDGAQTANLE